MALMTTTATRGARRRLPASATALVAGMVALVGAIAPDQAAAASNELSAGKAMPATGTTQTSFTLSVAYTSPQGFPASRVVALVANQTIEMTLFSGRSDDGVWEATTLLPAGSWPLTFQATAVQGKSPTLAGPTIVVSSAPSPPAPPQSTVSQPEPIPPQPRSQPPPVDPLAPPAPPDAAPAGATEDVAALGANDPALAVTETDPAVAAVGPAAGILLPAPGDDGFPTGLLFASLLVAIAAIGAVVGARRWSAIARRRRGEPSLEPPPPAAHPVAAATARPARRIADWELASLDDEPIGTVDYTGLQPLA